MPCLGVRSVVDCVCGCVILLLEVVIMMLVVNLYDIIETVIAALIMVAFVIYMLVANNG